MGKERVAAFQEGGEGQGSRWGAGQVGINNLMNWLWL